MSCPKLHLNNIFPLGWFNLWLPHISYRLPMPATLCFLVVLVHLWKERIQYTYTGKYKQYGHLCHVQNYTSIISSLSDDSIFGCLTSHIAFQCLPHCAFWSYCFYNQQYDRLFECGVSMPAQQQEAAAAAHHPMVLAVICGWKSRKECLTVLPSNPPPTAIPSTVAEGRNSSDACSAAGGSSSSSSSNDASFDWLCNKASAASNSASHSQQEEGIIYYAIFIILL